MTTTTTTINGIDTAAVRELIDRISADPANGQTHWQVASHWKGGARCDTHVSEYTFGGRKVEKDFTIRIDEPHELGGSNQFANPQEHLLAAMNACVMTTYTVVCALEGIELEEIRIETEGDIDLRGLFGLSPQVKPGYDELTYRVYIKGNGTPAQFQKVHRMVNATSPNRYNLASPIKLNTELIVE